MSITERFWRLKRPSAWEHAWKIVAPTQEIYLKKEPFIGTGPYSLQEIFKWIYFSWTKETSSDSENWSKSNPAWGQCAITAMMLHKLFRAQERVEIKNCRAILTDGRDISHYGLELIDTNVLLDFTKLQFPPDTFFTPWITKVGTESNGWDYVAMASMKTRRRYERLFDSVDLFLAEKVYQLLKSNSL